MLRLEQKCVIFMKFLYLLLFGYWVVKRRFYDYVLAILSSVGREVLMLLDLVLCSFLALYRSKGAWISRAEVLQCKWVAEAHTCALYMVCRHAFALWVLADVILGLYVLCLALSNEPSYLQACTEFFYMPQVKHHLVYFKYWQFLYHKNLLLIIVF